ncbi:unnamed protein product [Cuscuta campestris]|uniref:F-box associated domain-containing protein n=1 Tax=Cuscuta campestris TaxID=132261 RepID=A0A484L628_9ASTE|nr:unnamed protein product [Cuscuta campestris]
MNYPTALVYFDPRISLIKYEGSIAVVTPRFFNCNQVDCWVMKEYNLDSSWVNVLRPMEEDGNSGFGEHLMDVFGVRKNGELLVNSSGGRFSVREIALLDLNCHRKEQQLKHLGIWTHHTHSSVVSFVESLVLFDKGEQDAEGQLE